ncbi:hypothetical protein Pmar_PMAR026007 [Perkinsus marinus ATCC 50983]|uniref:Uncharacterized protein n=1 Tax=Perkinsus marinus (strain ATCC 50983 / TXsc) TaxID=423536 RepID=C5LK63_PERM5|nr:hypothetical protein Pmar_PMAR026007 [Perkinsus marinus ATCC 50983]EER02850.1 hypothetical protein Pmar_PMAR026007 [Perkinsus marinus ATCC 50983]|eukprot:XP_002771034.1 hypothetical protein Pmar_PMAR026007 [Perkinsus marinus ATCC 50983]
MAQKQHMGYAMALCRGSVSHLNHTLMGYRLLQRSRSGAFDITRQNIESGWLAEYPLRSQADTCRELSEEQSESTSCIQEDFQETFITAAAKCKAEESRGFLELTQWPIYHEVHTRSMNGSDAQPGSFNSPRDEDPDAAAGLPERLINSQLTDSRTAVVSEVYYRSLCEGKFKQVLSVGLTIAYYLVFRFISTVILRARSSSELEIDLITIAVVFFAAVNFLSAGFVATLFIRQTCFMLLNLTTAEVMTRPAHVRRRFPADKWRYW